MNELIYFYLIIGCYIAHRRTSHLDANSAEFLKTYLKIVCTYPKELFSKIPSLKKKESENPEKQQGE